MARGGDSDSDSKPIAPATRAVVERGHGRERLHVAAVVATGVLLAAATVFAAMTGNRNDVDATSGTRPMPTTADARSDSTTPVTTSATSRSGLPGGQAHPRSPVQPPSPPTTVDPAVIQAHRDLAIAIAPEQPTAHVGERLWVTVTVTNTSTRSYRVAGGSDQGIDAGLEPDERDLHRLPGSLPGLPPPGFHTGGDPLSTYLDWIPSTTLDERGLVAERIGRGPTPAGPDDEFAPGAVRTARLAIDVAPTGALPTGGHAFLAGAITITQPNTATITASVPFDIVDSPDRLASWAEAVDAVGGDPIVTDWIARHQGAGVDAGFGGVDVDVRFWRGNWELRFFESADAYYDSTATVSRSRRMLRVEAFASVPDGPGTVKSALELTVGTPASDDPDAIGARPDGERWLLVPAME